MRPDPGAIKMHACILDRPRVLSPPSAADSQGDGSHQQEAVHVPGALIIAFEHILIYMHVNVAMRTGSPSRRLSSLGLFIKHALYSIAGWLIFCNLNINLLIYCPRAVS